MSAASGLRLHLLSQDGLACLRDEEEHLAGSYCRCQMWVICAASLWRKSHPCSCQLSIAFSLLGMESIVSHLNSFLSLITQRWLLVLYFTWKSLKCFVIRSSDDKHPTLLLIGRRGSFYIVTFCDIYHQCWHCDYAGQCYHYTQPFKKSDILNHAIYHTEPAEIEIFLLLSSELFSRSQGTTAVLSGHI